MHPSPSFPLRAVLVAAVLASVLPPAWAQSREAKPRIRSGSAPSAVLAAAPELKADALSLSDMVARLRETNRSILTKQVEAGITATGIERAEAAFQPQASLAAVRGRSRLKNTFEEELIRQNLGVYEREGTDLSAGIATVLPATGAKVELKSSVSRFITNNNRNDPLRPAGAYDNRGATGISLTQPLARDAGGEVTQAKLNMARLDTTAADHASRDTEASVVAEAILAYHELVFAQQRAEAAQEKINTSVSLLAEARALRRQGRLAQNDVWEVENALARYKSAHSEAVQAQRERSNRLRAMLMMAPSAALLKAVDALPAVQGSPVDTSESLRIALSRRDDYQMRKAQAEREGLQLAYARNQKLPRIDLVASYGVNGLAYSATTAFRWGTMSEYPAWSVGLQMQIPLGENKLGRADVAAAQLRRENALLALKALEVQIANDIDTSLQMLGSATERWSHWQDVARREQQQLEVERKRFAAGRSEVREILVREERTINSRLMVLEQQAAHARAQVILESAQGVLLKRWAS